MLLHYVPDAVVKFRSGDDDGIRRRRGFGRREHIGRVDAEQFQALLPITDRAVSAMANSRPPPISPSRIRLLAAADAISPASEPGGSSASASSIASPTPADA